MADEAERDAVEEVDHPGVLEEAAEQDEQEYVRRRDERRNSEQTLGAEEELGNDLVEAVAAMRDQRGQVLTEQPVREEDRADQRQRDAQHASRRVEQQHDKQRADDEIGDTRVAGALDQRRLEHQMVEREAECDECEQRIVGGDSRSIEFRRHRVDEERQRQQEADVDRARRQA